ncbi:MAG TPA: GGDEF domain-containing protein [Thermoanaerobaculia bacterium]|nr:GGDEF domain-containing protein [Thermoanaerobaculia bacterium]
MTETQPLQSPDSDPSDEPGGKTSVELEPDTDGIDVASLGESGTTQTFETAETATRERADRNLALAESEADVILIAHPDAQRLGSRFRLSPGTVVEIGRSPSVGISLPEVMSISRKHARLRYAGPSVTVEDLGSTNGTFINGHLVQGRTVLKSGDRFQTAAVHFKFLHEQDVESAYHLAIYELVARDGLTEIFNKRKYEEEVQREFARAVRHQRPLSLILFDLDEFKQINDSYGHLCGDFVLKQVASLARDLTRPEEVLARVGGDEFAILVPETGIAGAETLAGKLRERIEGFDHRYGEIKVPVRCSAGVAELSSDMTCPEDLYEAADNALLLAKRSGRNRVSIQATERG